MQCRSEHERKPPALISSFLTRPFGKLEERRLIFGSDKYTTDLVISSRAPRSARSECAVYADWLSARPIAHPSRFRASAAALEGCVPPRSPHAYHTPDGLVSSAVAISSKDTPCNRCRTTALSTSGA